MFIPLFLCSSFSLLAQIDEEDDTTAYYASEIMREVRIFGERDEYRSLYHRARHYAPKMYPYALLIKDLNNLFDKDLANLKSNSEKKKYIKNANKVLKNEFTAMVKEMSESEGEFLCKLVHRETGLTVYDIIKKFKGEFTASTWQAISRAGGANLKYKYDVNTNQDYVTEDVVAEIRAGKIELAEIIAVTDIGKQLVSKRVKRRERRKERKSK